MNLMPTSFEDKTSNRQRILTNARRRVEEIKELLDDLEDARVINGDKWTNGMVAHWRSELERHQAFITEQE